MPNSSRILFVITDSGTGGTEKVLFSLLKNLPRDRFSIAAVVVLKQKREMAVQWENLGVPVVSLGMKRWPTPRIIMGLRKAIRDFQPDVVHALLFHSIQTARLVRAMDNSFALISSPRVNYRFAPRMALWLDSILKREDTLTLCESEAGRGGLIEQHGYIPDRVTVAVTSVDPQRFRFDADARARLRHEWGVSSDTVVVGSVGRLHPQKGFDVFIDALTQLSGIKGNFKAVLVGEGPEDAALKQLAFEKGVSMLFAGKRTDVPDLLSAFDVYVQSSRYEGLSNALLEAMSVGCACVATAVDGTMDFAEDGKNVLLVPPNDPLRLAVAIGTLIEKPALRGQLAENAKITASKFSLDRMIREFGDAYDHVRSLH